MNRENKYVDGWSMGELKPTVLKIERKRKKAIDGSQA